MPLTGIEERMSEFMVQDSATTFLDWWLGKDYASSQPIVSAQSGYGLLGYTIRFDLLVSLAAGIALCYFQYYGWLWLPVVYMLISLIKRDFCRTSEFYHFKRGLCGNQFRKVCRSEKLFQIFEHGSGSHDSYSFFITE